jgi:uncharacterized protein
MNQHTSHPEIIRRLKGAEGHLRGTIEMIEAGRSCLDIAQQLHAVESAVREAKKALIRDHIDHCLADAVNAPQRDSRLVIEELRDITKYL